MSVSRLALPLIAALVVGAGAGRAQQDASSGLQARQGPPSRTVHLDVLVTHKGGEGEAVAGLQAKDFTLLDDKKPQEITSFVAVDAEKDPVEAILLIDDVNTPYTVIAQERIQIGKFLRANGGKLALPLTLAVLTDTGVQMQGGYSRDGNAVAASLDKYTIGLRSIGRSAGTNGESDQLDESLKAVRTLATYESQRPGRKIVLWVSPGWPLLSGPGINLMDKQQQMIFDEIIWLSTELRESQTTLYAVDPMGVDESVDRAVSYEAFKDAVKKRSQANFGNLALQVLALQTGGEVLNSTGVSGLLEQCVGENLAYYRISFEPPPTERRDVYHELKVAVGGPGLIAHTSTGYYAQP
ncbi:MAG: VWA domain-containing protein [Acidobacteriaceae bacterium]